MKDIYILGLESSCDETAAAVVKNGREVLSNVIYSQIDIHTLYGGVVPEIASRKHIEKVDQVIEKALSDAGVSLQDLDGVAVTYGPGLVGPLLVGVSTAKGLAYGAGKPLIPVNHIEGHIAANYIEHKNLEPPFLCLVVSGGHTHLVRVLTHNSFQVLGVTQDDAAGEAFDKVARAIGLGYPGGPKIDRISKQGNPHAVEFPRAKIDGSEYDFSFSGVKSAVLNYLNKLRMEKRNELMKTAPSGTAINPEDIPDDDIFNKADIAASFQQAVIDVLVGHTIECAKRLGEKRVAIAGGVASNSALRDLFAKEGKKNGIEILYPAPVLCTDNGAMIAAQGYYEYKAGFCGGLDLNAVPDLKIGEKRYKRVPLRVDKEI